MHTFYRYKQTTHSQLASIWDGNKTKYFPKLFTISFQVEPISADFMMFMYGPQSCSKSYVRYVDIASILFQHSIIALLA